MTPSCVPYLRTSTDDKGQDPKRQLDVIQDWAVREGIALLEPVTDEGTSGGTDPFQRPKFLEAVRAAKKASCLALAVESPDRLTREGMAKFHVAAYRLEQEHGLKLWVADQPLAQQESLGGQIAAAIKAAMAKEWLDQHQARVQQGMDRAKAAGKPLGRPRKVLSHDEEELVPRLHAEGLGVRRIALEVNRRRGVFQLADPTASRQRRVSYGLIQRALRNLKRERKAEQPKAEDPS